MAANHFSDALCTMSELLAATRVTVLKVSNGPMKNFCYLVLDPVTRHALLVDPAWELWKIHDAIEETGALLHGVLLTHSHIDHTHLAGTVSAYYGCPVYMSPQEIAFSRYATAGLVPIEEEILKIGSISVGPIHTPGHTPGSVCFLIGNDLFSGDVLFAEGCGICPDRDAASSMFHSLRRLLKNTRAHTRVYPGHSYGKPPGQPMSQLLTDNIYLQLQDEDLFVAFRMRSGQSRAQLFGFV